MSNLHRIGKETRYSDRLRQFFFVYFSCFLLHSLNHRLWFHLVRQKSVRAEKTIENETNWKIFISILFMSCYRPNSWASASRGKMFCNIFYYLSRLFNLLDKREIFFWINNEIPDAVGLSLQVQSVNFFQLLRNSINLADCKVVARYQTVRFYTTWG